MNESTEWRTIPGWADYQVTRDGVVRRVAGGRHGVFELRQHTDNMGYIRVCLIPKVVGYTSCWDSVRGRKSYGVHRLVAAAWIGICPDGMEVNHKNGVKSDNRVENLEYVTHSENIRHAFRVLCRKVLSGTEHPMYGRSPSVETREKMRAAKLGDRHVRALKQSPETIREMYRTMTMQEVADKLGVGRTVVGDVIRGTHWSVRKCA